MTEKSTLAVWWVNQADCEAIGDSPNLPDYLKPEYNSRLGRAGRGRLWVPEEIELKQVEVPKSVVCEGDDTHGGIVILREDLETIRPLGGILSDCDGNVL